MLKKGDALSFEADFKSAQNDFEPFYKQVLTHIKGDALISVEAHDSKLAKMFDMHSGIDAVHMVYGQLRTVALRVQWVTNYRTFTIRYKRRSGAITEYDKRKFAIHSDKGLLYPYLTIQAYLDKRDNATTVLSCCIVKTIDLYRYIEENLSKLKTKPCPEGNQFLIVEFKELSKFCKTVQF